MDDYKKLGDEMRTYTKFVKEITNVRRWLYTTIYAYSKTSDVLSGKLKENQKINDEVVQAFNESGCNEYSLIQRFTSDNIKTCKELALIRSISALEVYLVDSIKEVFNENVSPFLSNDIVEYHIGEILSCDNVIDLKNKYIEKKCRNLHSSGFEDIAKYYKKIFSIEFSRFNATIDGVTYGLSYIQQYHQKRHLIIHQLGKTDEQYRKKYNSTELVVRLNESDLANFLNVLIEFAHYINRHLENFITIEIVEDKIEIQLEIIDPNVMAMFEPDFKINIQKAISIPLSTILLKKSFEGNILTMQLHGAVAHMRKYYKQLLKKASGNKIKILSYNSISQSEPRRKAGKYSWCDVEKVIELLPEKPWEKHIHKRIAEQLGWSNKKVQKIITSIVEEKPSTIKFEKRNITANVGENVTLNVVFLEGSTDEVEWKSSNSNVAVISDGQCTAVSSGYAVITARIARSTNYAVCTLTVI